MKKQSRNKLITYKDYLEKLNKSDLIEILNKFHIEYKKNCKKQVYIDLVLSNINSIVNIMLDLWKIKLIIKK